MVNHLLRIVGVESVSLWFVIAKMKLTVQTGT